jgi:hypothetical protein
MEQVFNLDLITKLPDGTWEVQGRAYEDVNTGDELIVDPASTGGITRKFIVTDVITYGKHVPGLSRMMTGALILQGEDDVQLGEAEFLYRKVS